MKKHKLGQEWRSGWWRATSALQIIETGQTFYTYDKNGWLQWCSLVCGLWLDEDPADTAWYVLGTDVSIVDEPHLPMRLISIYSLTFV